jgi:diguanylate cyclase (GGDEF)-like protein
MPHDHELPDFIIKSTAWVSLSAILILIPFTILSCLGERYLICILILLIMAICAINIWLGFRSQYNNILNLFGVALLTLTTCISLYKLGVVASFWPILVVLSLYFILPQKQARIINILFVIIVAPIAWLALDQDVIIRFFAVLFATSLFALTTTHEIYKKYSLVKEQSITDLMTGLYNRSLLQSSLENSIHQYQRANINMAILMIDIDHFKSINDQLGHDIGDIVLQETGKFLKNAFRASDMVFRIGGEEFMALIYNTDKKGAIRVAEKLRAEFEQLTLLPDRTITVSVGVAVLEQDMDWKQWMKQGDENLYQAKSNGRNQVVA